MAYNPSIHTTTQKAIGYANGVPADARAMFYDVNAFVYRPYNGPSEVLSEITGLHRKSRTFFVVNVGGTLNGSNFTGGEIKLYWFKDGVNLVEFFVGANITIGTTTTGNAGTNASVTITGTIDAPVLNFTIPRGNTGSIGPAGPPGPQGNPGVGIPTGGTTNQVLAKLSGADYDTRWIDNEGAITVETDPTVPSHVKSISTTNIQNWNTAFGWGNHAGLYKPLSYNPTLQNILTNGSTLTGTNTLLGSAGTLNFNNFNLVSLSTANLYSTLRLENNAGASLETTGNLFFSGATISLTGNIQIPGLSSASTKMMTVDASGNVGAAAIPSGGDGGITTETDPTVGNHIKAITTTNISNWNTAFGWGNHAGLYSLLGHDHDTRYYTKAQLQTSGQSSVHWLNIINAPAFITGNQNITVTGDVTGSGTTSLPLTLATVNSNVGTFNRVTVNAKGLVTAASNVAYLTSFTETDPTAVHLVGNETVSGNKTWNGITAFNDYVTVSKSITTANDPQLTIIGANNMKLHLGAFANAATSATVKYSFLQSSEASVSNDRQLALNPYAGSVTVGGTVSASGRTLSKLNVFGNTYIGDYNVPAFLDIEGAIRIRILDGIVAGIKENHVDGANGGLTLQRTVAGVLTDGLILNSTGAITIPNLSGTGTGIVTTTSAGVLGRMSMVRTDAQNDAIFHPLENQRLSTTNSVVFNDINGSNLTLPNNGKIKWGNGSTNIHGDATLNRMYFYTQNLEAGRITENRNWLFGTDTEVTNGGKVQISGNVRATGAILTGLAGTGKRSVFSDANGNLVNGYLSQDTSNNVFFTTEGINKIGASGNGGAIEFRNSATLTGQANRSLRLGTWDNNGAFTATAIIESTGVTIPTLAGTGTREIAVDSTGKIVISPTQGMNPLVIGTTTLWDDGSGFHIKRNQQFTPLWLGEDWNHVIMAGSVFNAVTGNVVLGKVGSSIQIPKFAGGGTRTIGVDNDGVLTIVTSGGGGGAEVDTLQTVINRGSLATKTVDSTWIHTFEFGDSLGRTTLKGEVVGQPTMIELGISPEDGEIIMLSSDPTAGYYARQFTNSGENTFETVSGSQEVALRINRNAGGSLSTVFSDNSTNKRGIEYGDDYHLTYTNRSLVDKEYVDSKLTGQIKIWVDETTISGDGLTQQTALTVVGGTGGGSQTLQSVTDVGNTTDNDIEITDWTKGIILTTSDGTRVRVTAVKVDGYLTLNLLEMGVGTTTSSSTTTTTTQSGGGNLSSPLPITLT